MREDWIEIDLEELADKITKGSTPTTYGYKFLSSGINFIKIENVKNGSIMHKSIVNFISEEAHNSQERSKLQEGDILFSIAGTIGETCLVKEIDLPANTNQAFAIISGFHKSLNTKFFLRQLESFVALIKEKARGGAMNNISLGDLKTFKTKLAPRPIQRAIVSKIEALFSDLDNGIANFKKAQEQLKIYRQAVLKKAFEGYKTLTTIGDEFDFIGGGTPSKSNSDYWNGELYWCSVKDVKGDYLHKTIDKITRNGLKESASNLAQPEEVILITRISPGKTIISKVETAINQDLKVVKPKREYLTKLIHYLFQAYEREIIKLSSGTTVLGINLTNLKSIEIPFCSIQEQTQIVQEIESRLSVCDKMEQSINESIEKAEALRQSILKKAFEGKLLSEAEIAQCKAAADYEPASELLKKIQAEKLAKEQEKKKSTIKKKSKQ